MRAHLHWGASRVLGIEGSSCSRIRYLNAGCLEIVCCLVSHFLHDWASEQRSRRDTTAELLRIALRVSAVFINIGEKHMGNAQHGETYENIKKQMIIQKM